MSRRIEIKTVKMYVVVDNDTDRVLFETLDHSEAQDKAFEDEPVPMVCKHCGETVAETEDGLWLHFNEDYTHLVRPVPAEHAYPQEG